MHACKELDSNLSELGKEARKKVGKNRSIVCPTTITIVGDQLENKTASSNLENAAATTMLLYRMEVACHKITMDRDRNRRSIETPIDPIRGKKIDFFFRIFCKPN